MRSRYLSRVSRQGVRPTTGKVLEALFDILDGYVDWEGAHVLDAFAGAGQLGFRALERGADSVVFVEVESRVASGLRGEVVARGVKERVVVLRGDAREVLRRLTGPFDVVFVDPPYSCGLAPAVLDLIGERNPLAPGGFVVVEHHHKEALPHQTGALAMVRSERYGETSLTFFRLTGPNPEWRNPA